VVDHRLVVEEEAEAVVADHRERVVAGGRGGELAGPAGGGVLGAAGQRFERADQAGQVDVGIERHAAQLREVAGAGGGHPEVLTLETVDGHRGLRGGGHDEDGHNQKEG
jgi:hypothetical protein